MSKDKWLCVLSVLYGLVMACTVMSVLVMVLYIIMGLSTEITR